MQYWNLTMLQKKEVQENISEIIDEMWEYATDVNVINQEEVFQKGERVMTKIDTVGKIIDIFEEFLNEK